MLLLPNVPTKTLHRLPISFYNSSEGTTYICNARDRKKIVLILEKLQFTHRILIRAIRIPSVSNAVRFTEKYAEMKKTMNKLFSRHLQDTNINSLFFLCLTVHFFSRINRGFSFKILLIFAHAA
jgi:hypothetical protein